MPKKKIKTRVNKRGGVRLTKRQRKQRARVLQAVRAKNAAGVKMASRSLEDAERLVEAAIQLAPEWALKEHPGLSPDDADPYERLNKVGEAIAYDAKDVIAPLEAIQADRHGVPKSIAEHDLPHSTIAGVKVVHGGKWSAPAGEKGELAMVGRRIHPDGRVEVSFGKAEWVPTRPPLGWLTELLRTTIADHDTKLTALGACYQESIPVRPTTHTEPLLPTITSGRPGARDYGKLFYTGEWGPARPTGGVLPFFREVKHSLMRRVPILIVSDKAGVPVCLRGTGAPLPLKLVVFSLVLTPLEERYRRSIPIAFTVREMRDMCLGRKFRNNWSDGRMGDWPKLRNAIASAALYGIPVSNNRFVHPLVPIYTPVHPNLDEKIIMRVQPPVGAEQGPPLDMQTAYRLGRQSGPKFRGYIATQMANWIPGKTRTQRGLWDGRRDRYPVWTRKDRRDLAFGINDKRNRSLAQINKPYLDLAAAGDGVSLIGTDEVDWATGARGWRIVPDAAAAAIRRYETGKKKPRRG